MTQVVATDLFVKVIDMERVIQLAYSGLNEM